MSNNQPTSESRQGVALILSSFIFWGLIPIYFKLLAHVPPFEVIAHRAVWTLVAAGCIMFALTRGRTFAGLFRTPRRLLGLCASACCIGTNWVLFVWAVTDGRIIETSLGYFINPLVSVLFGVVLLRERLRKLQWLAVGIAATGVLVSVAVYGKLPWVSLALAGSFGSYGMLRKSIHIDAVTGLFTETLLMAPFAIAYGVHLERAGAGHFLSGTPGTQALLVFMGIVTAVPLVLFAAGTRRINLSTVGILQYITPTLSFFVAVFLYHEAFSIDRIVTFGFIWTAVTVYTVDTVREGRRVPPVPPEEVMPCDADGGIAIELENVPALDEETA